MYKNFLLWIWQWLHNAFMTDNPSILEIGRILMVVDFPKRVVHGGIGKRHVEKTNKTVLDFSASVNPYPPRFIWNMDPDRLSKYPDDTYTVLKERISEVFHKDPAEICVGNGSIELIRAFCSVAFRKGSHKHSFFVESPTFGEYSLSALLAGAVPAEKQTDADVSFLCNPNNPTGKLLSRDEVVNQFHRTQKDGGLLFCDEAFIELTDPSQSVADLCDPSLFVLRSLTKCFSVPGIRFGYGFGDPAFIEKIETARTPWGVNAYAEAYAMEAFLHMDELAVSRSRIEAERLWLVSEIQALGMHCHPSSTNYILIECGRTVTPLCEKLATNGVLVRDCTSFGLPESLRVAVRTREENEKLIGALAACVR